MATTIIISIPPDRLAAYCPNNPAPSAAALQPLALSDPSDHVYPQIHYLLALSKTEHFGRAAEACHVSQPALSTAIQHLEEELGVTIVRRGQRFQGFTMEGERLLQWARILAQDWECMRQEAAQCNRQLTGTLVSARFPLRWPWRL